ncbi:MAG: hypothetical protein MMC23_009898 [Stictis urceolatum]|nr:hypothetical protein [Stictis urceolata]
MSPRPVLLVGSVPLGSADEVFGTSIRILGSHLQRIPDGETGRRGNFIAWQHGVFPIDIIKSQWGGKPTPESLSREYTLSDLNPTGYDDEAIASYATFCRLRNAGTVPHGVKFQVCLPSPLSVVKGFVEGDDLCKRIEPLYRERLLQALRKIQDNIPFWDLCIQFDLPHEIAALESDRGRLEDPNWAPYFAPIKDGVLERVRYLVSAVDEGVELGFHLCYGDLGHVHFIQPMDSALLVEFANSIVKEFSSIHPIKYIHMPVPKDRIDTAYYRPFIDLDIKRTQLYLGLVHPHDEHGTETRIALAQKALKANFGVSTECGMGRMSVEELKSVFSIAASLGLSQNPQSHLADDFGQQKAAGVMVKSR